MTHLSEEELILIYYDEPEASGASRQHLVQCGECRAAARALASSLNLCNEWIAPEPGSEFGRSAWAALAPKLDEKTPHPWWSGFGTPRIWVTAAAMAVLLLEAFIAGRTSGRLNRPAAEVALTAGLSHEARERIAQISLADHLDRAEILLTEISNATDRGAGDFIGERERAHDLVDESRLMRQTLGNLGSTATLPLVDEVERFMLEVANAPDRLTPEEVRTLQQRISSDSLLFKVRILETNLRAKGQTS